MIYNRVDKIASVNESSFKTKSGEKMFANYFKMENGDVFPNYSMKQVNFTAGEKIEYSLLKENGKTKSKVYKMQPLISNLDKISLQSLVFLDVETVRGEKKLIPGSQTFRAWEYKMRKELTNPTDKELIESYNSKAALFAEFAKVACVSMGRVDKEGKITIKTYYGEEKELLIELNNVLKIFSEKMRNSRFVGWSIIGFDVPTLLKRMIVNGIRPTDSLQIINEKPWTLDEKIIDLHLWLKSTCFYSASLVSMVNAMGLPSPKEDIDGSMVSETFYAKKTGIKTICSYCERDVLSTIQITQKLYGMEPTMVYNE